MANQLLCDAYPSGKSIDSNEQIFKGSIALAGSAVATGEPINWSNIVNGEGYNQITANGVHGSATALVTAFSASAGTVTATAANNFLVGQQLTFVGCTSTLGLLLNGVTVTVVTASATQFTFVSTATGTGTSEVGLAVAANSNVYPVKGANANINATITAMSASGGVVTVTAANTYRPGALVVPVSASAGIGVGISGKTFQVISSTGTAFTIASSATGATGTGTVSGNNCPQPVSVFFYSELGSGYVYQYSRSTGVLYVMVQGAAAQAALAPLTAGAYPSGVLNDLIRYRAFFSKS